MGVVEDRAKLAKLIKGLNARGDAKRIRAFVAYGFEPEKDEEVEVAGLGKVPIFGWGALVTFGKTQSPEVAAEMESRISSTSPGNCAALIYTSGTTGEPKAVMISHDNISCLASVVLNTLNKSVGFGAGNQ